MGELLKILENKNALSDYRDWITYFNLALETKLEPKIWSTVKFAVYRKVTDEKENCAEREKEPISQLENVLKGVNMSIYEYELLIWMKDKSNREFHKDKRQTRKQAELQLKESFPKDMMVLKEPLQKGLTLSMSGMNKEKNFLNITYHSI
ncbi:hypothetical protein RhiirA5_350500 [Rhizophagus irregularis]|uniref:Uncharacterized protein n=3 Tax=Rhizophagus irregularis TaxID=588596 RepID=U9T4S1_RHIID|nr:hypothetical protein GLOIN_2v1570585 [Rhizophagus irregularis DAOM 181602=DAOM 197198]EXX70526.1 hypothetical protein RirG_086540 [Rhizophagus irregularis DAOM 197198w]PKC14331.1 hypothetical protein RhiirA5_350500 [Rhizophagus irregularis]PKY23630.1 hypothetical protein RhiirB3_412079 [Rhizophagus irregularis]POG75081.1 hypothetical protein GLOIN_2v1570585 [Rhizophagus irregularis DAOM 181602=DAOM 197198]UZO12763.1 hypothetical protein OCT59_004280 [Rhizophagus irregularis]|eukprot:XP_025181947.1 hypothetical protein GLOIN_2v1570585 [Rhizophagus irregularis DAOM 181602=DAOM 197198]